MSFSTNSAAELIAESFNEYFGDFDARIGPADVVVGGCGTVVEQPSERHPNPSWHVRYRVDADQDGQPCLEFYAISRWTDDRHARIAANGRGEHLEAVDDVFADNPNDPPEARAAAREEFNRRNRDITTGFGTSACTRSLRAPS